MRVLTFFWGPEELEVNVLAAATGLPPVDEGLERSSTFTGLPDLTLQPRVSRANCAQRGRG
jgi:hypothetical protein